MVEYTNTGVSARTKPASGHLPGSFATDQAARPMNSRDKRAVAIRIAYRLAAPSNGNAAVPITQ